MVDIYVVMDFFQDVGKAWACRGNHWYVFI
jgi:hypothetical protein